MPLVVGYTWDGSGPIWGCVVAGRSGSRGLPGPVGWRASGVPQGGVDARVGDVLAVIKALGVNAEQDFDAAPGPLGDPWRGHPGCQPERYRRVAQIVGATGQGRGDLDGSQGDSAAWRRSQPGGGSIVVVVLGVLGQDVLEVLFAVDQQVAGAPAA